MLSLKLICTTLYKCAKPGTTYAMPGSTDIHSVAELPLTYLSVQVKTGTGSAFLVLCNVDS